MLGIIIEHALSPLARRECKIVSISADARVRVDDDISVCTHTHTHSYLLSLSFSYVHTVMIFFPFFFSPHSTHTYTEEEGCGESVQLRLLSWPCFPFLSHYSSPFSLFIFSLACCPGVFHHLSPLFLFPHRQERAPFISSLPTTYDCSREKKPLPFPAHLPL